MICRLEKKWLCWRAHESYPEPWLHSIQLISFFFIRILWHGDRLSLWQNIICNPASATCSLIACIIKSFAYCCWRREIGVSHIAQEQAGRETFAVVTGSTRLAVTTRSHEFGSGHRQVYRIPPNFDRISLWELSKGVQYWPVFIWCIAWCRSVCLWFSARSRSAEVFLNLLLIYSRIEAKETKWGSSTLKPIYTYRW